MPRDETEHPCTANRRFRRAVGRLACGFAIGLRATCSVIRADPSTSQSASTTAPTTRPKSSARLESSALDRAVGILAQEYEAALKDPEKPVRVECDYFRANPSPHVTPAGVLAMLERTASGDPRVACYVKWQLLSAVEGKFNDTLAPRAAAVYGKLPPLAVRPGMSDRDKRELDVLAQGQQHDAEEQVENRLLDRLAKFNAYNSPLLRLRDELYAKLPPRYDALAAGWADAGERLVCGVHEAEVRPLVKALLADTTAWLNDSSATPRTSRELRNLSRAVARLGSPGPTYYESVKWRAGENRFVWRSRSVSLDGDGAVRSLAEELAVRTRRAEAISATTRSN